MIAYNLTRVAAVLATGQLGKARTGTIRTTLINLPARISYSATIYTLHLPITSSRELPFINMFTTVMAPPQAA